MTVRRSRWTERDIPDQSGRTVVVTGANSGLGLRTAEVLAEHGARVLLACRSPERGERALAQVAARAATRPEYVRLDLADLASVRDAATRVRELTGDALDVLVNNAGVMGTPRGVTVDGFETQFGTNHLGHAALTWLLLPALRGGDRARVVTVSSLAAVAGRIDLADPHFERRAYNPVTAYSQAKLANQVFAIELDRRLRAAGDPVTSVAAHPGYTASGLASTMARSYRNALVRGVLTAGTKAGELLFAQSTRMGALPQLHAATAPEVRPGDYVGPARLGGARGYPARIRPLSAALDPAVGSGLWDLTAKLTGITPDPA
ncbi:NAD(P)-dependent dehydrogenase (short-subunit alcohol dehydrogenase family) [Prauserella shujinwangii]|uniref:NAD(P)-dependent dehydrogenase (Short-subunit alcohol dehydrogenase family) n=1 Tax=Prauserella shujinwangii TaxID=1453103 RepID=A0A2T0LWT6_9PSEU|nr:oxidoreductase [Prauserella shujinwangii]PRX48483.1 NAD(P)-dependent dehydrogenase (short-subunit alcohol dehydrogenase family) [Prauserella shujinwangii]